MKINYKNGTIELTKAENKEAEVFGSQMYKDLREVRLDNPTFRVKVVSSKNGEHHKGLTADAMKKFIMKHDDEEHTILKEFYELRGLTPEGKKDDFGCAVSYGELKQWFFVKYPQYETASKSVEEIMKKVREAKEKQKEQKAA